VVWFFPCGGKILLEGLECYKDTQVKACDITKLTNELKSSYNVHYRNKIYYFVACFDQLISQSAILSDSDADFFSLVHFHVWTNDISVDILFTAYTHAHVISKLCINSVNGQYLKRLNLKVKVKVWTLAIASLTWVRLVTSSALQSRKWQLKGMSIEVTNIRELWVY